MSTLLSIIRSILGIVLIAASLYYSAYVLNLPVIGKVVHLPSILLVIGVMLGVTLLMIEFHDLARFASFLFNYNVAREKTKTAMSEANFERMLNVYVKDGGQALRQVVDDEHLPSIWKLAAAKLEIKVPVNDIRHILDYQIRKVVAKLDQDIITLRQLGALAPAAGMFGTVLGLIKLLAEMEDFSTLSSNMALALITTLYGILLGNVIFMPLARRVEKRKYMNIKNHENLDYWLSNLESGKPSFYLKKNLKEITSGT